MEALLLVIGLLVGGAVGALATVLVRSRRAAALPDEHPDVVRARHQTELLQVRREGEAANSELRQYIASLESTVDALQREVRTGELRHRDLVERQRAEQLEREAREGTENRVLQQLAPVRESLHSMQQKVAEIERERAEQHGQLSNQLRAALESDERLRATTETLASALRSNNTRGVWGETQLRSVVEAAGLLEVVDFDVQTSSVANGVAVRPDMVVKLPGGKSLPVDAKVPFNSYLEAVAIPLSANEAELARRKSLMDGHVKALRSHIAILGSKSYWDAFEASPEMVIAFIPSESLIASAVEADPSIFEYAFSKRVALASPVTLWSLLKTVAYTWQQDVVTQEAKQLLDVSRELYTRLATMADHVARLGRSIEGSVKQYNNFVGSLERSVLPSARKLNALDASKLLPATPAIEESPRDLVAPELLAELEALESARS